MQTQNKVMKENLKAKRAITHIFIVGDITKSIKMITVVQLYTEGLMWCTTSLIMKNNIQIKMTIDIVTIMTRIRIGKNTKVKITASTKAAIKEVCPEIKDKLFSDIYKRCQLEAFFLLNFCNKTSKNVLGPLFVYLMLYKI